MIDNVIIDEIFINTKFKCNKNKFKEKATG